VDEGVISPNRPCRFVGAGVGEGISVGVSVGVGVGVGVEEGITPNKPCRFVGVGVGEGVSVEVGVGVGVRVRVDEVNWVQSESSASICPSLSSSNSLSQISTSPCNVSGDGLGDGVSVSSGVGSGSDVSEVPSGSVLESG
jgi:hypothetical protein